MLSSTKLLIKKENPRKGNIIIKRDSETSSKYGKLPGERTTEEMLNFGVVVIDKPRGPTSHQVSAYVQTILGLNKSGHSGTLDPKVTGVLPIALGRATRVVEVLLESGKEYVALMHIHKPVSQDVIKSVCKSFVGTIKQIPPIKSSVKRQERQRNIYYLEIIEIDGQDVLFRVGTQAGTYIRKLIHDIGQKLGCGAHMTELRRTKAGPYLENTATTLQELADAFYYYKNEGKEKYLRSIIQPPESAVQHIAKVWVLDTTVDTICHGASLKLPGISRFDSHIRVGQKVAVFTLKNELVCLGTACMDSDKILKEDKGIAVRTDKVFMLPGTYPKIEKPG
ncbi:MAG: RNA-guided pseudouridylation complex pseudouridine synthase subunit Cbf5 [Candidatus Woesearchaeota archaeon]